MFVGYSVTQKGYKCYVPETRKILVSRDVKFMERQGFYEEKNWDKLKDLSQSSSDRAANLRRLMENIGISLPMEQSAPAAPPPTVPTTDPEHTNPIEDDHFDPEGGTEINQDDHTMDESIILDQNHHDQSHPEPEGEAQTEPAQELVTLRRSQRERRPASNWINTRVYYNAQAVAHPVQASCSLAYVPPDHKAFLTAIDQNHIPRSYEEAKEHKEWREAVNNERKAMEINHTWEEADLPKEKKTVSSRWIFTIKYDTSPRKHKGRHS